MDQLFDLENDMSPEGIRSDRRSIYLGSVG
jgi:hypothetical protein